MVWISPGFEQKQEKEATQIEEKGPMQHFMNDRREKRGKKKTKDL